jgi:hypothetical protein
MFKDVIQHFMITTGYTYKIHAHVTINTVLTNHKWLCIPINYLDLKLASRYSSWDIHSCVTIDFYQKTK